MTVYDIELTALIVFLGLVVVLMFHAVFQEPSKRGVIGSEGDHHESGGQ